MVMKMSGGICNLIKFRTLNNTAKYYWIGKRTDVDYPSQMIGTKTPSMFIWSKMEHMVNIMSFESQDKIIEDGKGRELTAIEFIVEISHTRMWTFDFPLGSAE